MQVRLPIGQGSRPHDSRFVLGFRETAGSEQGITVAGRLLRASAIPAKAWIDAIHVAVAVINRMDYLVTWNLDHIANAANRGKIEQACRDAGLRAPIICTPEELMEA